ncbi:MAG: hypothetical protein RLY71_2054 [Pseudomonadota bacterium]|jgi:FHA domain-containing protein
MAMILHALSLDERALSQPLTARFDEQGGSIGRADHNTLALPDPERVISRIQAEISGNADGSAPAFTITNVSRANPIVVAGRSLSFGESSPLRHRDVVRIGGYLLEAEIEQPAATAGEDEHRTVVRPRAGVRPPVTSTPMDDPFADLLPPAAQSSGQFGQFTAPATAAPAPARPAVHDPFADPPPAATPPAGDALADLVAGQQPGSIDDIFGLDSSSADPLVNFMAETRPRPMTPAVPFSKPRLDPVFDIPIDTPSAAPMPAAPTPTATPVPTALPSPRPAAMPAACPPSAGMAADPLWAAFCEGAGVQMNARLTPELMRVIGGLLRSAVDGTQQLVTIRAAAKYELRAQVTMIRARNNNPLKFVPDGAAALEQLLQPPMRGFLEGPQAMTDAMNDLVGHSIGTMAGMRAALEGVLDRFTPAELEHKLGTSSMLDSLLPMSRKARLWELYLQHFQLIRSEAQEDFHTLFGKAFLAAYEQQLERLQAQQAEQADQSAAR